MRSLYYTAPTDQIFNDLKNAATIVWNRYDDPYRTEKLERIKNIGNVGDNFMYLFAMFDMKNMREVSFLCENETKDALRRRLLDGGQSRYFVDLIVSQNI